MGMSASSVYSSFISVEWGNRSIGLQNITEFADEWFVRSGIYMKPIAACHLNSKLDSAEYS